MKVVDYSAFQTAPFPHRHHRKIQQSQNLHPEEHGDRVETTTRKYDGITRIPPDNSQGVNTMSSVTDYPVTNPFDSFLRDGKTFHKNNLSTAEAKDRVEVDLLMAYGIAVKDWWEHPSEPTLIPVFEMTTEEDAETIAHIMQHLIVSQYVNYPEVESSWDTYNPCPTDEEIQKEHEELELVMFRFPVRTHGGEYMIRYSTLGYWKSIIEVPTVSVSLYLILENAFRQQ